MNNPENIVQRQLDAYNARDIERLLSIYATDAQMYEHPSTLIASGSAALAERFKARFKEPNLHAKLLNRMVMGNVVIDHEQISRTFPEGPGEIQMVMIYQVQKERITKVWVISGEKALDPQP